MFYKLEVYNISTIHKIKEKWIKRNDNIKKNEKKNEMKGTRRCVVSFSYFIPLL